MVTIISQLNSAAGTMMMMMGWKCNDNVLGLPNCSSTRQVTSINFPSSTSSLRYVSHNSYKYQLSHVVASALPSTRLNFYSHHHHHHPTQEYFYNNNDHDDVFAAEKIRVIKPSVGISTNPSSHRNFVDIMSRIVASLLSYGVVFTFITIVTCLYTSNSALAVSYSRGPSSFSSSSSSGQSSLSCNYSDEEEDDSSVQETCNCDTSCTRCIPCNIREAGYQCQEEEQDNDNSTTRSCSCNCHDLCYFHKDRYYSPILIFIQTIFAILFIISITINLLEKPSIADIHYEVMKYIYLGRH